MVLNRKGTWAIVLAGVFSLLGLSCQGEAPFVELMSTPLPPGAMVQAMGQLDVEGESRVFAASSAGLFSFRRDEKRWEPLALGVEERDVLQALTAGSDPSDGSIGERMVAFGGELWMMNPNDPMRALVARVGGGVRTVGLPRSRATKDRSGVHRARNRWHVHRESLYLLEERAIWKWLPEELRWKDIGLSGVSWSREERELPLAIRHYLPRGEKRNFECLTVMAGQLLVYRRSEPESDWLLVATLAAVDQQLVGTTHDEAVYLLASDSIYRSEREAEGWMRLRPDNQASTQLERMMIVQDPEREEASLIFVSTQAGSIWRKSTTEFDWRETEATDADHRSIGVFYGDPGTSEFWAGTWGRGILHSADGGLSWSPRNEGLLASVPSVMEVDPEGRVVIGTPSGGYVHVPEERAPELRWRSLSSRAISSVLPLSKSDHLWGTWSGELVRSTGTASQVLEWPDSSARDWISVAPSRTAWVRGAPRSLIGIGELDDDVFVAWSNAAGGAIAESGQGPMRPLVGDGALAEVLSSSELTDVFAYGGHLLLAAREVGDRARRAQVWVSPNRGESWISAEGLEGLEPEAIRFFAQHRGVRSSSMPARVFAYTKTQLFCSDDGGLRWRRISGPWQDGRIVAAAQEGARVVLLAENSYGHRLYLFAIASDAVSDLDEYLVESKGRVGEVSSFVVYGNRLMMSNGASMVEGRLPRTGSSTFQGFAFFSVMALLLAFSALGFVVVRRLV